MIRRSSSMRCSSDAKASVIVRGAKLQTRRREPRRAGHAAQQRAPSEVADVGKRAAVAGVYDRGFALRHGADGNESLGLRAMLRSAAPHAGTASHLRTWKLAVPILMPSAVDSSGSATPAARDCATSSSMWHVTDAQAAGHCVSAGWARIAVHLTHWGYWAPVRHLSGRAPAAWRWPAPQSAARLRSDNGSDRGEGCVRWWRGRMQGPTALSIFVRCALHVDGHHARSGRVGGHVRIRAVVLRLRAAMHVSSSPGAAAALAFSAPGRPLIPWPSPQ